jgi:energy-coupling factor transporter ATP-binding protein EcfA2
MKISYIRLENVVGIFVGSNKDFIEIDFTDSRNKIICIEGANGSGKSVLLSSLTPFASVTSVDERSTLSYIIIGKNGFKQINYVDGDNEYIIKHYYKASKDTHTIKSYFSLNGIELNETGNVTSFLSLVELHFGLTQEMMRLIRLGTNVLSFISLKPAQRKEYIGKLIEEIDLYLKIYRKINDDIRVIKLLLTSNNTNLYNCHISDLDTEQKELRKINNKIHDHEKERDIIIGKINRIVALEKDNNIDDLKRKRKEAEASLFEFKKTEEEIITQNLKGITIDSLISNRTKVINEKIDIQSKINSYRITIDSNRKNIEKFESSIKNITSNNDLQSLIEAIDIIRGKIQVSSKMIKESIIPKCNSDEVNQLVVKLSSFNQISQMIYTFGNKPVEIYLKLKRESKSVDKFLKDQMKKNLTKVNDADLKRLLNQVFQSDQIITPNCDIQFQDCPYYRLFEIIDEVRTKLEEECYDDETLRYIQVISNNIDNILNEIDKVIYINLPDKLKMPLREKYILDRLHDKLPFFDLSELYEYLSYIKEYELYTQNVEKLKEYEYQLSIYKKSGIDIQIKEIKELKENIVFYQKNIQTLENELVNLNDVLERIDKKISILTKYNDGIKYKKIVESTLESTNKILLPLESSSQEKVELTYQLNNITNVISQLREDNKNLENKINEYIRLSQEEEVLSKKHKDLLMILESVSTKKGIPVLYMKTYLGKIQKLTNNLLKLIYNDNLLLSSFKVTQETFEIPYIKNGTKVMDVRYASQSEVALITMALSFALSHRASGKYNILLLDEIDSGLDDINRLAFLKMLERQMYELKAEQVFLISHNLTGMMSIPMDSIRLSNVEVKSKLSNVIYS